jgi:hypothetical protein
MAFIRLSEIEAPDLILDHDTLQKIKRCRFVNLIKNLQPHELEEFLTDIRDDIKASLANAELDSSSSAEDYDHDPNGAREMIEQWQLFRATSTEAFEYHLPITSEERLVQ